MAELLDSIIAISNLVAAVAGAIAGAIGGVVSTKKRGPR